MQSVVDMLARGVTCVTLVIVGRWGKLFACCFKFFYYQMYHPSLVPLYAFGVTQHLQLPNSPSSDLRNPGTTPIFPGADFIYSFLPCHPTSPYTL